MTVVFSNCCNSISHSLTHSHLTVSFCPLPLPWRTFSVSLPWWGLREMGCQLDRVPLMKRCEVMRAEVEKQSLSNGWHSLCREYPPVGPSPSGTFAPMVYGLPGRLGTVPQSPCPAPVHPCSQTDLHRSWPITNSL